MESENGCLSVPVVVLDALPYVDPEYGFEGVKDRVNALVQTEMKSMPALSATERLGHLPPVPSLFQNDPALAREMERIREGHAMPPLDTTPYQMQRPKNANDLAEWKKAVDNVAAQLQHQNLKTMNLELLNEYGANAWRLCNYEWEALVKMYEAELESTRSQITELNKQRKSEQLGAYGHLQALQSQWRDLVHRTAQLELVCAQLESQLSSSAAAASPSNSVADASSSSASSSSFVGNHATASELER